MATIVTRAGKGSPLTHEEVDSNFVNLNTDKAEASAYVALNGDTMTGALVLPSDPTSNLEAATKQYVDTIAAAGIHYHDPVRVETPSALTVTYDNGTSGVGATLTNAGAQAAISIDGITLDLADRVLVYNQANATQNGVYTVTNLGSGSTNWVLTRSTDTDSYAPSSPTTLGQGDAFFVLNGNTGAGELYVCNTVGTITFGTTNIMFSQIASTAVYSAGTGLALTGTVFSNTITNNNQLTNGAGYITSDTTKLPLAGGAMTGAITTNSTFDGRDVSVDGAKLDGIAAGANNYSFPYTVSAAESLSTVVQRDGNGYIFGAYFNGTGTFSTTGLTSGMGRFTGTNGSDPYGRSYTAAAARTLLNVADGATNVTNTNQLTNGAGYTTYTANQAVNTSSSPSFVAVYATDWFYSSGATGWYNSTYVGGWFMNDTSWVRSYNDKGILTGGTMQAGTFNTTSDIKLKENVKTITGALDTVCALRGVTFDWIATKESTLGFIAQEVEKVVPELVSHNVEDDIKTVNYGNMVALLTEAVKELKAEIEELKKR
jgi:hypothetical protein